MRPQDRLIATLARQAVDRVVRRTVSWIQKMKDGLQSGDDSGLTSIWDEVCVQVQGQESILWRLYDELAYSVVAREVQGLTPAELQAVWLQTDEGVEWMCENAESRLEVSVYAEGVVPYMVSAVYARAGDWSNRRIREYLE